MGLTMDVSFPELSSFGTLLRFALALEAAAKGLCEEAGRLDALAALAEPLAIWGQKHGKRGQQLEQMRRERLNEVVLQPISGMERADYQPALDLTGGLAEVLAALVEVERRSARFYDDAAAVAVDVLGGVERFFKKLAKENREIAQAMAAKAG